MRISLPLLASAIFTTLFFTFAHSQTQTQTQICDNVSTPPSNNCISFSVGSGTGCAWMCNYCATNLNTNNYYFTDNVCSYQQGTGCVGNPVAGKTYTCCSV